jgi:hypothetical protein
VKLLWFLVQLLYVKCDESGIWLEKCFEAWHLNLRNEVSCSKSGVRREIDDNCALLDYYAASSGNSLSMFWTIYRFRNVSKQLPLHAAQ